MPLSEVAWINGDEGQYAKVPILPNPVKGNISVNKELFNKYLSEHISVFSDLGDIIEKAKLVNQTSENKNRSKYNLWNYYYSGLKIKNTLYNLEFDVVSRTDGENHYRLQRIEKADTQSTLPLNGEVDLGAAASSNSNIPNSNENVKLPPIA